MELRFAFSGTIDEKEIQKLLSLNDNEQKKIKKTHLVFYIVILLLLLIMEILALVKFKSALTVAIPVLLLLYFGYNFYLAFMKYKKIEQQNKALRETQKLKVNFFEDEIEVICDAEKTNIVYKDILEVYGVAEDYYMYTKYMLVILVKNQVTKGKKNEFLPFLQEKMGKNKYVDVASFDFN